MSNNHGKPARMYSVINNIIIIIIAGCIIFLNIFITSKIKELEFTSVNAMFIKHTMEPINDEEFNDTILKYKLDTCNLIEIYDYEYNLLFAVQSGDESNTHSKGDIANYPELIEVFDNHNEGGTSIHTDTYDEEIYFKWYISKAGNRNLLIVYSTRELVDNIWIFHLVSYILLILVFVLLIRNNLFVLFDKTRQYKYLSDISHKYHDLN